MDIYEFIESKDIREHCRKMQYEFTALESAFLIWQSDKTIQQKHAAYREIIEVMPDERLNSRSCTSDVGRILRTFKIKKNVEVTDNGKIII